MIFVPDIVW